MPTCLPPGRPLAPLLPSLPALPAAEVDFVLVGVLLQLASICTESVRLTLVQILLQRRGIKMNPVSTLYHIAPCCFVFLFLPFTYIELPKVPACLPAGLRRHVLAFLRRLAHVLRVCVFACLHRHACMRCCYRRKDVHARVRQCMSDQGRGDAVGTTNAAHRRTHCMHSWAEPPCRAHAPGRCPAGAAGLQMMRDPELNLNVPLLLLSAVCAFGEQHNARQAPGRGAAGRTGVHLWVGGRDRPRAGAAAFALAEVVGRGGGGGLRGQRKTSQPRPVTQHPRTPPLHTRLFQSAPAATSCTASVTCFYPPPPGSAQAMPPPPTPAHTPSAMQPSTCLYSCSSARRRH